MEEKPKYSENTQTDTGKNSTHDNLSSGSTSNDAIGKIVVLGYVLYHWRNITFEHSQPDLIKLGKQNKL